MQCISLKCFSNLHYLAGGVEYFFCKCFILITTANQLTRSKLIFFTQRSTSCLDAERKNNVILRISKPHRGLLVPPCDYKTADFTTHLDAYRPLHDACRNNSEKLTVSNLLNIL